MKQRFLIDGRFLSSLSTGVDRYAYEIIEELDKLDNLPEIHMLVPADAKKIPDYRSIKVIKSAHVRMWTQIVFALYARLHGYIPVNLCNEVSLLAPKGICALHDVCYAEHDDNIIFPEDEREWFLKIYQRIKKRAKKIITVTEFSKSRIEQLLSIEPERIEVISNGWQHFADVNINENVFDKYPKIQKGEYFFTMSSANPNKNVKWVAENAKKYPENQYVIGGKNLDKVVDLKNLPNITYVGFLKDEDAKAFMKYAKAFVFPSFYEGFGIPPIEAMSAGARVISSKAASLPEVLGDSALYIDPEDAGTDLNRLLENETAAADKVLCRYSWEKSAVRLKQVLETF